MADAKKKSKPKEKREYDKPVSLAPLSFEEAVAGLLQTAPPPKEKAKPKQRKKKKAD